MARSDALATPGFRTPDPAVGAVSGPLSRTEKWTARRLKGDHMVDVATTAFLSLIWLLLMAFSDYAPIDAVSMKLGGCAMVAMAFGLMAMIGVERTGSRRLIERRDKEIRDLHRQLEDVRATGRADG